MHLCSCAVNSSVLCLCIFSTNCEVSRWRMRKTHAGLTLSGFSLGVFVFSAVAVSVTNRARPHAEINRLLAADCVTAWCMCPSVTACAFGQHVWSYLGVNPAVSGFLLFAEPVTETHTSFSHVKWSESSRRLQCVVTFQEVVRPLTLLVVNFKHFYELISTCCSWHQSKLEMWTSFPAGGCLVWLGVWLWSWDWLSPQHFTFNSVLSPRSTFYCKLETLQ